MAEVWPLPDNHQPGDPGFTSSINQLATNLNGVNDRTVDAAAVQAAQDAAAASASAAAASAQTAHDISNIDTSDDVVSTLVADPQTGPKTTAALNAAFGAFLADTGADGGTP